MKESMEIKLYVGKVQDNQDVLIEKLDDSTMGTRATAAQLVSVMIKAINQKKALNLKEEDGYELYIKVPSDILLANINIESVDSVVLMPSRQKLFDYGSAKPKP